MCIIYSPCNSKSICILLVFQNLITAYRSIDREDVILTEFERNTLDKFKARVLPILRDDYMKEDIYLISWLRAQNLNINKAEEMLQENLNWRERNRLDGISSEDWSDMLSVYPFYLEGRDRFGKPILYTEIAGVDFRRMIIQGKVSRLERYHDKWFEEACTVVRSLGKKYGNITRGHFILNMDSWNLVEQGCPSCIPVILYMVTTSEQHWPLCLDKVILLNTPSVFQDVLQLVKNFMKPESKRGLLVFGKNKEVYKRSLYDEFDFNQLPVGVGGTKIYKGMEFSNYN